MRRSANSDSLHQRTTQIGAELLASARQQSDSLLSARFWSDKLMDWAMTDQAFKAQLFRFVDVFPSLRTPAQVHEHLLQYIQQPGVTPPPGMGLGLKAGGFLKSAFARTVASQITSMATKFIAGRDAADALPTLAKLWKQRIAFSVDLLGEACVSEAEADAYRGRYLNLIEELPRHTAEWRSDPLLKTDHLGNVPRVNVSIKISSLAAQVKPADFAGSIDRLVIAVRPILESAAKHNVLVNFDMEQHELKDLTLTLFERCCETFEFPAGLAMQAYLRSGDDDAARIVEWSKRTGRQVTVRLVKGAYWDYEVIQSEMMNWPTPVWTTKRETDACFERMTQQFIAATPRAADEGGTKLALGSHNARSIAFALAALEQHDLPTSAIELQMLHGMADALKLAAVQRQLRVREYVPVGEMIPGMAYLVRRLLENTSNESWLKAGFHDEAPIEQLLASPHEDADASQPAANGPAHEANRAQRHQLSPAVLGVGDGDPFMNEPQRDFADAQQRQSFANAVAAARPPQVKNDTTVEQARGAIAKAAAAFEEYRDTDPRKRANLLVKAAALMRDRRDELAGMVIRESGKPWADADADVCEAIDFCEYYARHAPPLFEPRRLGRFVGELNEQWHQPRGVAAIISPWNFPLAICTGMTAAALVTGNCAIVKPAEQTPGVAKVMCEIFWQAGTPREVLHFVAGQGETVGAALVRDPRVALIAFTGSKAVGLDIVQAAAMTPTDQPFVKKVVCEMGGKNAIIIDSSADLDEAVVALRQSAFGYAGQKCSACSRAIVLDDVHDLLLSRLVEASRALVVGDPLEPGTDVGPVIDDDAAAKIRKYLEIGRHEGELSSLGSDAALGEVRSKPLIAPHIFAGIEPHHRLAQEEVFGPVLAVIRAKTFTEAIAIANSSTYKLTGGVFSRTPDHLSLAKRAFRAGNLYLNRGITGALVGRQPFGGFGLSGVGSKAGSAEYLLQFVEPRTSAENTMRRGFSPEL